MRIGLFGGSFNPIHNGHVTLGRTMLREMRLDEVWFLVSPHNPLKESAELLDEQQRLRLTRLAVEDWPGLCASDYEFALPRPSYTWNTLQHLHHDFPQHEFVLIIGGDNWEAFDKWAHHDEILATHEVAVFPREGAEDGQGTIELPANVHLINVPLVNVTSTMLRQMLRQGQDISQYVPAKVAREITEKSLYR